MSTEDKKWIEHRINEVCGGKIGLVHPEFFIGWKSDVRMLDMDNTASKYPHFKSLLVNPAGKCLEFGESGCN